MTRFTLLILASAVIPASGCASAGLPLYPTAENINARPFFAFFGGNRGTFRKPDVLDVATAGKPLEVAETTGPAGTKGPIKLEPLPAPAATPSALIVTTPVVAASEVSATTETPSAPIVTTPVVAASEVSATTATPSAPIVTTPVVAASEVSATTETPSAPITSIPAAPTPIPAATAVQPTQPAPVHKEWTMRQGETFRGKVAEWARLEGWNRPLVNTTDDWEIEVTPPPFTGTFEDALSYLRAGFGHLSPRPRLTFSTASKSILIEGEL